VSFDTGLSFFNARETVMRDTPAARATSRIVTADFEELGTLDRSIVSGHIMFEQALRFKGREKNRTLNVKKGPQSLRRPFEGKAYLPQIVA
jgi:hypothetical protein